MSPNNPDPLPIEHPNTPIAGNGRRQSFFEVPRYGVLDSVHVVYKAEWYHNESRSNKIFEISSLSDLKVTVGVPEVPKVQKPVLEVITTIYARERKTEYAQGPLDADGEDESHIFTRRRSLGSNLEPGENRPSLRSAIDEIEISRIGKTRIVILSPSLLNALRRSIDYYPHQDLTGDSITISEPYMCLIHYYDVLKKSALPCEGSTPDLPCKLHSHASLCDKETKSHVQILLDFLTPTMESTIVPALKKLDRDISVVTFDTLWLLFKPDTEIYSDIRKSPTITGSGFQIATVVYSSEYKTISETNDKDRPMSLVIKAWFMCCDGERVGRSDSYAWIPTFEGEKEVTQLPLYPARYADPSLRAKLISLGRMAHDLYRSGNRAIFFDGRAYRKKKVTKYRGRAVIDPVSTAKYNDMDDLIYWHPTLGVVADRSPHLIELGGNTNKYSDYESLSTASELTDHQCFLMFPFVGGFGLDDKEWMVFHVDGVQSARYDQKALDKLVLDSSDLNIIKAISYRQALGQRSPTIDFIEGKGQGQVILLHGPPGVGKTYTVESIAAYFGRPLLSLSIADIGTKEESMENVLSRWFNLAETWNAVLLIDESDVFLEKRAQNNLGRNGLVSVFLRKMEYFQGLLFLTTNRIGQIDDAFSSRIHAKIQYPKLDNDKRAKIWEAFFEKLKSDSGTRIYVAKTAKDYVLQSPDIMDRQWNGREIRNAFQTTIALAEYEASEDEGRPPGQAIEVKKDHFIQVMEMSRKFIEYVDSIDGRDEAARAKSKRERSDTF